MEVISEKFEVRCKDCKSLLNYTNDDIDRDCITRSLYIICPICGHKIWIEYANVTKIS